MRRDRYGFTLVEVALFLAITSLIFVGVAVGTQNSIFQQRYNDAVQNFAEFLRNVYSQVSNVQNESDGRSDKAIYGKLVTFNRSEDNKNSILTYNVIGNIADITDDRCGKKDNILEKLDCLKANVIIKDGNKFNPVGFVEDYKPRWASQIQTTDGWGEGGYDLFVGAVLIVRHPSSGTIYTFVEEGTDIDVSKAIRESNENGEEVNLLNPLMTGGEGGFEKKEVVFCLNPNGADRSSLRRGIKIVSGARNASGVEVLPDNGVCRP